MTIFVYVHKHLLLKLILHLLKSFTGAIDDKKTLRTS